MQKLLLIAILALISDKAFSQIEDNVPKGRLLILADMGNEPDEEQQMMHMLLCSNEFDLEGLIAVTGKFLRPESKDPYRQELHPELFHRLIDGYEKVVGNLKKHADGWPDPNHLRDIVFNGQPGYGIESTGEGLSSEGSDRIIQVVEKEDERPLYIVVNAGSNTLAQALKDYRRTHTKAEVEAFVQKLRVFENGAQDNAGAWICSQFPDIHWVRSNYQAYCYGGPSFDGGADNKGNTKNLGPYTWEPFEYSSLGQHQWVLEHIIVNHGPFGTYYPLRQFGGGRIAFIEGGGTVPWLALINKGLSDIDRPWWGGWSGRYSRQKNENIWSKHASVNEDERAFTPFYVFSEESDVWIDPDTGDQYDDIYTPVWRWRRAFFNDFRCRMDWCIQPFENANHHPKAVVNGDASDQIIKVHAKAGEHIRLDASASTDPDHDGLSFYWWQYPEAGTYSGKMVILNPSSRTVEIQVPTDAANTEIHVVLEVKDDHPTAVLYDYRRVVIEAGKR